MGLAAAAAQHRARPLGLSLRRRERLDMRLLLLQTPWRSAPMALLAMVCLAVWAGNAAHAAAPTTGPSTGASPAPGVTQGLTPAPPTVTSFTIDGGAAVTPKREVNLSWTLAGPAATHFRVSESASFPNQAWNPMPQALPWRWTIGSAGEGPKTVHVQFMNTYGQSAVRSASIELRTPLAIQSFAIENGAAATSRQRVNVRWANTGTYTHYRVGPAEGADAMPWLSGSAAPSAGVDVDLFEASTPDMTTRSVRLELRRDNDSPVVAKAFIRYERPLVDLVFEKQAVKDWILATGGPQSQTLGGAGTCSPRLFETGGDRYFVAEGGDGSLRCQFSIFQGVSLAGRWKLKKVDLQLGHAGIAGITTLNDWKMPSSTCRFISGPALGTNQMAMAIEVYHPGKLVNPTDVDMVTACLLTRITLTGPQGTNPH